MKIQNIDIASRYFGISTFTEEIVQIKSLPFFSIAQLREGSYEISFAQHEKTYKLSGLQAFIAPSKIEQRIKHLINPDTGIMSCQWLIVDVKINNYYSLEDLFDFPILLPTPYQESVNELLFHMITEENLCYQMSDLYRLIDIFFQIGVPREPNHSRMKKCQCYIEEHYREPIAIENLLKMFQCSKSTFFREFQETFGMSPINYINHIRLSQAVLLMQHSDIPIAEISERVGISDPFYFSKLFKKKYGQSPKTYRDKYKK